MKLPGFAAAAVLLLSGWNGAWALTAEVVVLAQPGLPVGSTVMMLAALSPPPAGERYIYRFETAAPGQPFKIVRDFSPVNTAPVTFMHEGTWTLRTTVVDQDTGATETGTAAYGVISRVSGANPVLTPLLNPLVALYSAPACPSGQMRVRFRPAGGLFWTSTPPKTCNPSASMNFILAGMRADTDYEVQHDLTNGGGATAGPILQFRTGIPAETFPTFTIRKPPNGETSFLNPLILHAIVWTEDQMVFPVATDLFGRVIWYYKRFGGYWNNRSNLMRPVVGGNMLFTANENGVTGQLIREIDIAGHTVRESSIGAINRQLAQRGLPLAGAFHHEVNRLPNGKTVVLASQEKTLVDVQGPGPVNVLGDMVIVLDDNWQVDWVWSAFDHVDTSRPAVLGEICTGPAEGCPTLFGGPVANDWLHSNSATYSPADGNLIISLRHRDWVVKIDYQDGLGTGAVVWRLGRQGDFALASGNPLDWFSHQHDVRIEGNRIVLYDNGNTRQAFNFLAGSRGQIYEIDEQARTARLVMNVNLGTYSGALGSAERLSNGNYHFESGILPLGLASQAVEVTPDGRINYVLETSAGTYRSWRMRDLYTPQPN